jgi:biuret amidohydrolase
MEADLIQQVDGIYPWPYDGRWMPRSSALIVIDMQRDFLATDGWFSLTGGDTAPLMEVVPAIARTLEAARSAGLFVVFTIEAHRPDLADLPRNKYWRSRKLGCPIGEVGPLGQHLVRGTRGAEIVAPLHPRLSEPVIAKPGKSAFVATDIDHILRMHGIRNLIFVGVTTDGAVQCTLRDATASDVRTHHVDQLHTLSLAGGVYGSIASVENLLRVLRPEGAS